MIARLESLKKQFFQEIAQVREPGELSSLRDRYLGRKSGAITALIRELGTLPAAERREFGQGANELKQLIESRLDEAREQLERQTESARLAAERLDVTLPGIPARMGHRHPITLLLDRLQTIFVSMGYSLEDGPEIETNFFNFDALNIPEGHPARDQQDTFYISIELALRTQTSTVQIRTMQRRKPPLRIIAPGKVFRRDTPDPTHNPMFFQLEGLAVDRHLAMSHLKGTIQTFVNRMFGPKVVTRFRPSYFPFVEPGGEVDFSCISCDGQGCRVCKGSGWIELGGCGMVHPHVLEVVGIDPNQFSGFAFGLGVDRMAALMYGLDDIRLLYENDLRFLSQFPL